MDPGEQAGVALSPATFQETVYQCSGCHMTSFRKSRIADHLARKNPKACCVGARLLSGVCTLSVGNPPARTNVAEAGVLAVAGDHTHNTAITINVYAGSEDDREKLLRVFSDRDAVADIAGADPADIPATLFRYWKGANAPPSAQNVRVDGNTVHETRAPGARPVKLPRTRYVRRAVGELIGAAATAQTSADPETMRELQGQLTQKTFAVGKKAVSHAEAAAIYATGAPEYHKLDADGRQFVQRSHARLDAELDALPPPLPAE